MKAVALHSSADTEEEIYGRDQQHDESFFGGQQALCRLVQRSLFSGAVMLDLPEIWENRERYLRDEKEDYDMCKAVREWSAEERRIGREEGREEGLFTVVKNMLFRGMSEEDIIAIAECDHEFVVRVRESCV